ncbi:hypothetical protein QR680_003735 [Steinernema hermaphroditum]|uniref:RING-type E3 ubiquitin transferase n=1 Tax=Steinernema hermaphroditum TaxID=289476 RepID=A0AA39LSG8_9BILA|nr:hypothetical protein QR680_003735 [Steinernema hermaphroditum]
MQWYSAERAEIVRAERRDEEHVESLEEEISNVIKSVFGTNVWRRYYKHLHAISEICYYFLTTLSGKQTLGEEYLGLVQVDGNRSAASLSRRFFFVVLHSLSPYLLETHLKNLENTVAHPSTSKFLGVRVDNNEAARESFKQMLKWIRLTGVPLATVIHLAVFYLNGTFYNISKRLAGIEYLSMRPQTNIEASKLYKFLGYVSTIQSFVTIATVLYSLATSKPAPEEDRPRTSSKSRETFFSTSKFKCPICLESSPPATTPCGHLFCWKCIIEHAHNGADSEGLSPCPQCRSMFHPNRVVPLINL